MSSRFADRVGGYIDVTDAERQALSRLEQRTRSLRRGAVLLREHDPLTELFVVEQGMMMSYVLLADGSRQILQFLFPGDLVAASALVYRASPETVVALTDCVVCPFERATLAGLIAEHPRLSAIMVVLNQMHTLALTDRLAVLGRTSAKARVAALLLEVRNRLRAGDATLAATFAPGLTQEEIGDATGLTAVHVNRMLRQLEEEGLIARDGGRVTLIEEARLARLANHVDRYRDVDLGWLPPPR